MVSYNFSVYYDDKKLHGNQTSTINLAPSLLALSLVLQEIQHLVNQEEPTLSSSIVATEKNRFIVYLESDNGENIISRVINLLTGKSDESLNNLISYTNIFGDTINFIKKIFNHKIKQKDKMGNENVKITLDDNTSFAISKQVLYSYKNINIRKNIREILKPLEKNGITKIDFCHDEKHKITVNKNEYKAFDVLPQINKLKTSESIEFLQIINADFRSRQWEFSDGSNQFLAQIEDKNFLKSVKKNQQQFGSTDILRVQLKTQQYLNFEGILKQEQTIVKVLEHKKGNQ